MGLQSRHYRSVSPLLWLVALVATLALSCDATPISIPGPTTGWEDNSPGDVPSGPVSGGPPAYHSPDLPKRGGSTPTGSGGRAADAGPGWDDGRDSWHKWHPADARLSEPTVDAGVPDASDDAGADADAGAEAADSAADAGIVGFRRTAPAPAEPAADSTP